METMPRNRDDTGIRASNPPALCDPMTKTLDRRTLLATVAGAAVLPAMAWAAAPDPWKQAEAIVRRLRPPSIPKKNFPITRYGAQAGGVFDCTAAIAQAIDAASKAGGGRILV